MSNTITVELNSESINNAIAKLEQIKERWTNRSQAIIRELLRVGITTAQQNTGKYAGYIKFETVVQQENGGSIGLTIVALLRPVV